VSSTIEFEVHFDQVIATTEGTSCAMPGLFREQIIPTRLGRAFASLVSNEELRRVAATQEALPSSSGYQHLKVPVISTSRPAVGSLLREMADYAR